MNLKEKKKKEEYTTFTLQMSDKEYNILLNYGRKMIVKDPDSLINYAVVRLLQEYIDENEKVLKKEKKT